MLTLILALVPSTPAAEVQVALAVPINVLVDGVPIAYDDVAGVGVAPNLPAGRHVVETRNLMGKTTAYKEVDLAVDDQIRFEYRQKELWHIGTYKIAAAPETTTVVVQTTTTPVVPGIGIVVSDGTETVSVGAGVFGTGVVVSDGTNTVALNGGVQVTETTTTTTVVTHGVPVAEPEIAPVVMDARSFNALIGQLDNASFSDDKLSVLRSAAANNWMSCEQLARLLDTFSFGEDKVQAVAIVRPSIVDPQNAFIINDKFSFSSDAQKAQAYFR